MTTTMPSRAQIDRAGDIDFDKPRSTRNDLTITIKANVGGFDTEICYTGSLDQLETLCGRLRDLGASPAGVHQQAPAKGPQKPAQQPEYDGSGDECCPVHHRKLRGPNQWGKLYCTAKDGDAYCKYTWKAE